MNDTILTILIVVITLAFEALAFLAGCAFGWSRSPLASPRRRRRLGRFARARSPLAPRRSLPATDLVCELRVDERAAYLHLGRRDEVGGVASTVDTLLGSHGILMDFDAAARLRGIEFLDLDRVPTGSAPRRRSGVAGLGDALRAVDDGVSQVSWPPAERFAADLDTETGSDVLTDPWIYRDEDWEHGMLCEACEQPFRDGDVIRIGEIGETDNGIPIFGESRCPRCIHGRPLDTEDAPTHDRASP
jgi:hypothetical protein